MRRRSESARLLRQETLAHDSMVGLSASRTSRHDNGTRQILDCRIRAEDHHLRGRRRSGNPLSPSRLARCPGSRTGNGLSVLCLGGLTLRLDAAEDIPGQLLHLIQDSIAGGRDGEHLLLGRRIDMVNGVVKEDHLQSCKLQI